MRRSLFFSFIWHPMKRSSSTSWEAGHTFKPWKSLLWEVGNVLDINGF